MADRYPECQWTLTTPPAIEPFTVGQAKAQIRSVQDQEDDLIRSYIRAATQAAENWLGRGLLTQTWTLAISDFLDIIPLPMAAPLQSVTSVKYYDVDGNQQMLSATIYTVDTTSRPGRVALAANQTWPAIQSLRKVNRIEIAYVVGYTTSEAIPEDIKQGMRLYIAVADSDRAGSDPTTPPALNVARWHWTDRVFWVPPRYAEDTY